jgi:hypothetical protein
MTAFNGIDKAGATSWLTVMTLLQLHYSEGYPQRELRHRSGID